ncbi:hypothetical protein EMIHUDRAFT_251264, partial [Emiliania huxleyi CCMP1516]
MGLKSSSARPSQRGVANASRKRSSSTPTVPTRQSSRTRNVEPEFSGVAEEHRDGRIELDSGDIIAPGVGKPDERDGALLRLVTSGQEGGSREEAPRQKGRPAGKGRGAAKPPAAASSLARCSLAEADVAKVTKSAVVHLQFQPRDDTLLLAAGDKDGHVSLWHCDRAEDDP